VEVSGFTQIARRWWWLLVAATLMGAFAGYGAASRMEPTYEARVRLLVGPIDTDLETQRAAGQLAQTYAELVTSRGVREATAKKLGIERIASADVEASANDVTRILTIRARSSDPREAGRIANALITGLRQINPPRTARPRGAAAPPAASPGELRIVDPARERGRKIAPRSTLIVGMGGMVGLLIALAVVVVAEYVRDRVRGEQDVEAAVAGLPVLGSVEHVRSKRGLEVIRNPKSKAAAEYGLLAARFGATNGSAPGRTVLVVGAQHEDGSGVLAANLAAAVARTGLRVTLVDAAHDRPEISRLLSLERAAGLSDALGPAGVRATSLLTDVDGIEVLPRGEQPLPDTIEPGALQRVVDSLRSSANLVIVNAPPVTRAPATLVLARLADSALIVVPRDRTTRRSVTRSVEALRDAGANVAGAVLSGT
jgi:succinoglycan biosynthesis transport protein ExoP